MRSHLVGARSGVGVEHAVGEIVRDRCVRTDAIGKDKPGIAMISISPLRSCGWPSTIVEVLVLAAGPPAPQLSRSKPISAGEPDRLARSALFY